MQLETFFFKSLKAILIWIKSGCKKKTVNEYFSQSILIILYYLIEFN